MKTLLSILVLSFSLPTFAVIYASTQEIDVDMIAGSFSSPYGLSAQVSAEIASEQFDLGDPTYLDTSYWNPNAQFQNGDDWGRSQFPKGIARIVEYDGDGFCSAAISFSLTKE